MIILQMEFNNLIWHGKTSLSAQPSLLSVCLCSVAAPVWLFFCLFSHVAPSINSAAETTVVHEIALVKALPSRLQPCFRAV